MGSALEMGPDQTEPVLPYAIHTQWPVMFHLVLSAYDECNQ